MNIAIVDDQLAESRLLDKYIKKYIDDNNISDIKIHVFGDAAEYLNSISKTKFEISFLDILMGEVNGVDVARTIRRKHNDTKIVFCTSSNEYAVESYEVNATQYLLKPFTYEQFEKVMRIVIPVKNEYPLTIQLKDDETIIPRDIIYTEYFNHKITIHYKNGEPVYVRMNQANLEARLKDYNYLIPCNRGIMVNIYEISSISNDELETSDGTMLPISRSRIAPIKKAMKELAIDNIIRKYK